MKRVFVVTAIRWDGDWILGAEVGEADVHGPSGGLAWKAQPRLMTLDEVCDLIETTDTVVTSKTRSGTPGPTLCTQTHANGSRTIDAVQIPGVTQDLSDIRNVMK